MEGFGEKYLKKILPGLIGLLISGLVALAVFPIEQKNDETRDRIGFAEVCPLLKSSVRESSECIVKNREIPLYENELKRNYELIDGLVITSRTIAAFSGIFIVFTVLQNIFSNKVAPALKKLRANNEIDQAVKKIVKYQKLRDAGVLTQEQYDRKVKELQKIITG